MRVLISGLPRAPIETIMTPFFSAQAAASVRVLILGLPRAPIEKIIALFFCAGSGFGARDHFGLTEGTH